MKKLWLLLASALVLIAPWVFVFFTVPVKHLEWGCKSDYEINSISGGANFRVSGQVSTFYHADGTGVARFAGTLSQELPAQSAVRTSLYRATEFDYSVLGAFVRVTTNKATTLMGDNTTDDLAIKYGYKGFKPGYIEYFQIIQVGGGAVAAGFSDMPRIYCQSIDKARASD
jgi:hypothetical protein